MNDIHISESIIQYLCDRGLTVTHRKALEEFLYYNSYFRVSEYLGYRGTYSSLSVIGMRDDELRRVYTLDALLRQIILEGISIIEIVLRSRFMYALTEDGHNEDYLDIENYKEMRNTQRKDKRQALIESIQRWMSLSKEDCIRSFRRENKRVPLYVVIEILPFGTVSEMMSLHKDSRALKSVYSSVGLNVKLKRAHEIIHSLVYLRNLAAHHARLWMRRVIIKPPRLKYKDPYYSEIQTSIEEMREFSIGTILLPLMYLVDTIQGNTEYSQRVLEIVRKDTLFYKGITNRVL